MIRNGHFQFTPEPAAKCTSNVAYKMYRSLLILILITRVSTQRRSVQQSVFVSRKSRSNSAPTETGYVYSQVDNYPGTLAMYGSDGSDYNTKYSDYPYSGPSKHVYKKSTSNAYSSHIDTPMKDVTKPYPYTATPMPSYEYLKAKSEASYDVNAPIKDVSPPYTAPPMPSYEYLKAKAETKYESNFLPSKLKSDAMYDKLKALMHYKYPDDGSVIESTYMADDYHVDDDDVRSSSRTSYDGWPYFYHSPYEYESMKVDSDKDKAKDKRYILDHIDNTKHVIPVHEDVDDIPHYYNQQTSTPRVNRAVTTDNPIYGDQPFFSFVLNDYFDKSNEDDSLVFKGLDWEREFDHEAGLPEVNDYLKRNRRVGSNYSGGNVDSNNSHDNSKSTNGYDTAKAVAVDSTTEKGYDKKHKFDKHEKGNEHKENHKSAYENAGNNFRGFKDFADSFANKFGGQEHKKDSKFMLKTNQDKGEKRKGFRRVYHKDEYQEEDEFYDNSNSSAKGEEKGGSSVHLGDKHGTLQSHSVAATGNEANAYNNAGNTVKNNFENNHTGNSHNKGFDSEFNRYRDVAKKAALSNSAHRHS